MRLRKPAGANARPNIARLKASRYAIFCLTMVLSASGVGAAMAQVPSDWNALIEAAKSEGELTFYTAATENVAKRTGDGFTAKYGIATKFLRLAGVPLTQRYANEAIAGNYAADLLLIAGDAARFGKTGIENGWLEAISAAKLPAIVSGEFPAKYVRGNSAVVQIGPWLIGYNTEKVKGADIPKTWPDVLDPKWKGQIFIPDPANSDAYLDVWAVILDRYGKSFFARLRAQEPQIILGANLAVQRVAAGEGSLVFPQIVDSIAPTKAKGAPLATVTPDLTSGVEMQVLLTARDKAKHPNAARLFANYMLSREGNLVMNDDPAIPNMYDTSRLPKEYVSPKDDTILHKQEITALFRD